MKKGFTLIELLAVIVILAILALIVSPIISGVISSAKQAAAERSMEGYVQAVNIAQVKYQGNNGGVITPSLEDLVVEYSNNGSITNQNVVFNKSGLVETAKAKIGDFDCTYTKGQGAKCTKGDTPGDSTPAGPIYTEDSKKLPTPFNTDQTKFMGIPTSELSFNRVKIVNFYNDGRVITDYTKVYNVSSDKTDKIKLYIKPNETNTTYQDWYFVSDETIVFNEDSSNMFINFSYLENLYTNNAIDTTNVINMEGLFRGTGVFSQGLTLNLNDFNTSNVTNMSYMFYCTGQFAKNLNIDLGDNFDTKRVETMNHMFSEVASNAKDTTEKNLVLDLGTKFDTSNVTDMNYMFSSLGSTSKNLTLDLSNVNFDTAKVTDMGSMFSYLGSRSTDSVTLKLGTNFDTKLISDFTYMFNNVGNIAKSVSLSLGNKFSSATNGNMSMMFYGMGTNATNFSLTLNNFDTSNVTNMSMMFANCGKASTTFSLSLGDSFNPKNVTNMSSMFSYVAVNATSATLNLGSNFDTSKVTDMSSMFSGYGSKMTNFTLNLGSKFNTTSVKNMKQMFSYTGSASTGSYTLDLGQCNFNTSNVENMYEMFRNAGHNSSGGSMSGHFSLHLGNNFNTVKVTDMTNMFSYTGSSAAGFVIDLGSAFKNIAPTNDGMFSGTGISGSYVLIPSDMVYSSSAMRMKINPTSSQTIPITGGALFAARY